jgi:hypothetical protein
LSFITRTVEIPEAMLAQFGLDQFKTDGRDSAVQAVLAGADAESLLNGLASPPEGVRVIASLMNAPDGMQTTATFQTPDTSPDGQTGGLKYTFGLSPNLTADQKAVNLAIRAEVAPQPVSSPGH